MLADELSPESLSAKVFGDLVTEIAHFRERAETSNLFTAAIRLSAIVRNAVAFQVSSWFANSAVENDHEVLNIYLQEASKLLRLSLKSCSPSDSRRITALLEGVEERIGMLSIITSPKLTVWEKRTEVLSILDNTSKSVWEKL